jgi:hypothetical protein
LDGTSQLVPDGGYDVVLRAAAPGLTPLPTAVSSAVVDTTAPVAGIASPGHLAVELSSHPLGIRGSAQDVNFASYSLAIAPGNPPGSFATFASSQLAVTGVPPADLLGTLTTLAHSPGDHTLRLTVVDLAGNSTTVLRPFTLDYITVTNVSSTPKTILPEDNELVGVTFTVSHDCDAAVEFYRWPECTLVRTVSAENLGAGMHTLLWNGKDANGSFAPDRLHHFVVRVSDAAGRDGHFNDPTNPFRGTGASWGSTSITTSGFNAHRNDVIVVNYQVNGWLDCQITVQGTNLSVPLSPTGTFPPGPHVAYWDGRNQNGQIHTGNFNFYFGVPADLPHPSVFVKRGPTHFLGFRAQAYLIHPVFSQVSGVSYELTREATVSIVVQDPNGNHVKTLLPATLQNAGIHGLDAGVRWDGCDEAGRVVSLQGTYSIVLTAVDPLTGHAYTRRGAVRVYH